MSITSGEFEYQEKPLTLVSVDPQNGNFIVNYDTLEYLKSINEPIAIISVAGLYRTGKSYLLNKMLLNTKTGFGVGPTINPCTKGLWIWGKPLKGKTPDGDDVNVLVIDSEGIGALDQESGHDARIFSLAILFASAFLYNSIGSIDEQAIENLSLVVNLTKNIQVKAQHTDDVDIEDYAKHFPTFVWIVRDFALQLIDAQGEPITSKNYLEKALQHQKGFSDNIEQKNRIRSHITGLFRNRDCFTFVRPVTKEEELQNLNQMDFSDLRPEFVEQVIELRKRVLNRIQPKTLNGRPISGEIFSELVKSYVGAINEGAVPNIENTWTQICRNECHKYQNEALKVYETYLVEEICPRIPLAEDQLKLFHKRFKEKSVEFYKSKALGEVSEVYEKELLRQIKIKFQQIKVRNLEEGQRLCDSFLVKEFSSIEMKVKTGEYPNYQEFERDINLFYTYFMEKGPDVPRKDSILLEFLHSALRSAGNNFVRNALKELELHKNVSQDVRSKLEAHINELKSENTKERNDMLAQLSQLQTEKTELELRETTLKENLHELKTELGQTERSLREELAQEKLLNKELVEKLKDKLSKREDMSKDLESQLFLIKSEFEKEKALLVQKTQFLEKSLEEYAKKDEESQKLINLSKSDFHVHLKETTNKYEQTIRSLQDKIETLNERIHEFEDSLKQRDVQIETLSVKNSEQAHIREETIDEYTEKLRTLEAEMDSIKRNHMSDMSELKSKYETRVGELNTELESLQTNLKQREEQLKDTKAKLGKENALLQQKLQFVQMQLDETKAQLEESRKNHDTILNAFEKTNNDGTKMDSKQVAEIKESHIMELKQVSDEYEATKKKYLAEVEQLTTRVSELELQAQLTGSAHETELSKLKEELETVEANRKTLAEQNRQLEAQKKKIYQDIEQRFSEKIAGLENEIEEKEKQHEEELKNIQQKSEQSLLQLKILFDQEKMRYEKRIQDEKDRAEKTVGSQMEELETRLHEEEMNHQEEIEAMNEEFREKESQYQSEIQTLEHELKLRDQSIETLEKYLKETKESLNNLQTGHTTTIEQHLENFNKERKGFLTKIESLSHEISRHEKDIFSMKQKNEQLESNLKTKEETIDTMRKEYTDERNDFLAKLEEGRQKYQKLNDEYLEKKVEFGKESALNNQQNEFFNKRIEDLTKQIEDKKREHEEKLRTQKEEFNKEIAELGNKLNLERKALEEKFENKRRIAKETDNNNQKKAAELEKERAILEEKLHVLEKKNEEYEKKISTESEGYSSQVTQLKESFASEKKLLQGEIEKLRSKLQEIEHESAETQSNYERDKALWEGKCSFLENQRDQTKADLADYQKKFETAIQQLQKVGAVKKEECEKEHLTVLNSLENRYQKDIVKLTESFQQQIDELNEKKTKLEKELKSAQDKMLLENYGKIGNQNILEKKIAESMENEKKLLAEIDELKSERDAKSLEYQKKLDKETESLRSKIKDLEVKFKDSENKKSVLMFEHEKERAKWNLEKDYLSNQRAELQDTINKLEKKKEQLLRENEKMRNDSKTSKRLNVNTSFNTNNYKPASGVLNKRDISPSPANQVGTILDKENVVGSKHSFGIKPFEQYKLANLSSAVNDGKQIQSNRSMSSNTNDDDSIPDDQDLSLTK